MLLMLLTLLFVAWLVKYPDIINATVYISTPNPPIDLVSPISAQIEKVFINSNSSEVKKGSPLVLLKSTASFEEVQKLEMFLEELSKDTLLEKPISISTNFSKLGLLQNTYNQLATYLEEYNEHIIHTPYEKRIFYLEKIIMNNSMFLESSEKQYFMALEDTKFVYKSKEIAEHLFSKGVIAKTEYDKEKQTLLQKQIQLESNRASLITVETNIVNLKKQLAELKIQKDHFSHEIRGNIKRTTKTLSAQIEDWSNKYVISAPINSSISVYKEFHKGDYLTAGSYLLTILPLENQELFAYGSFPVAKAGKLSKNHKAIIKLDAYPYREYGSIDGFIEKISDFPIKNMYSVKIRLPNRLKTGYDKKIIFKQRLSGQAELITENRSLLSRIFSNFKYFVEERVSD